MAKKKSPKTSDTAETSNTRTFLQVAIIFSILAVIASIAIRNHLHKGDLVNRPFDVPLPIKYDNQAKWGSLRSGAYFGMKTISPASLATGLMWFKNKIEANTIPIRHWCSQHDGLTSYGWKKHNFHDFGIQEIIDGNLRIITSFVVHNDSTWSTKVAFSKVNDSLISEEPMSLVYYVATENNQPWTSHDGSIRNDTMDIVTQKYPHPSDEPFIVSGSTFSVGDFEMSIGVSENSRNVLFRGFMTNNVQPPLKYLKETILQNLVILSTQNSPGDELFVLRGLVEPGGNWIAHQVVFNPPLTLFVEFSDSIINPGTKEASDEFDVLLAKKSKMFDEQLESIFPLKTKGYSSSDVEFAQAVVSNMIGSIGFFNGFSKVRSQTSTENLAYGPLELLTGVPSRSFFPRGFLWDEGFHLLLISRFDHELSVEIIKSWLNLMNAEGWIPREVILGAEAEARVPSEFVVQKSTNANPPTVYLALESLIRRDKISKNDLKDIFPRLEAWYNWFNLSQFGEQSGTYRWRGRNPDAIHELNPKTLTSGLDDYPRATHPTDSEYHIDLRCWMALASRVMSQIAEIIDDSSVKKYQETQNYLSDEKLLTELHWSKEQQMFCDFGLHSPKVKLQKPLRQHNQPEQMSVRTELIAPRFGCVPEIGYVSLFPFLLQVLEPSSDKLPRIMTDMSDPSKLWTPFGLRSLAKNSRYYNKYNTDHDPPYWRGAIWINMNFLALRSLNFYSKQPGPHAQQALELYTKLREAVVSNVIKEYRRSGYVWENYDDTTGRGKGSHPFTGWTALVVLIMAEEY